MTITRRPSGAALVSTAVTMAAAVALGAGSPGVAVAAPDRPSTAVPPAGDAHSQLPDLDIRKTVVAPSAGQKAAAAKAAAGARGSQGSATVKWNRFGSVGAVRAEGKQALATGLGSDPVAAARTYLRSNAAAFGISAADVKAMQHVTTNTIGGTSVVMLRQTFNGIEAGIDGLVVVAVEKGNARYVSSTLAPTTNGKAAPRAGARLTPEQALDKASRNVGKAASKITRGKGAAKSAAAGWTTLEAQGLHGEQHTTTVAVPVPGGAPRTAYHVVLRDAEDSGYSVYVDAANGEVIARDSLVDFDSDNPRWKVFTGTPETDGSGKDTRVNWCMTAAEGCAEVLANPASAYGWDIDPATGLSTGSSIGNNATTGYTWDYWRPHPLPVKADRNYQYPFTNQWQESGCDPAVLTSPERNDVDAATANLFAMHNRMHDWSYHLGFTESAWNMQDENGDKGGKDGDAEDGYAQAGALYESRNNANQGTPPDGFNGYSNMYLWQPLAGSFYAPCVDGDFDMSVIGHEYGHAISNRMVAGPNSGLSGTQARAMGESWSDLLATEYLQEFGYTELGPKATPMGSYVTGNSERGIRNYNYSKSPLNYSNIGYDIAGDGAPHPDGEIWSAAQSDIRAAFMARYGNGDAASQRSCATGQTPVEQCPGNRRWIQLIFDAWLLMPQGSVDMLDARDAMLTADQLRFGGANQDLLWNGFAERGFGQTASATDANDVDPVPGFTSPHAAKATLRFNPTDEEGRPVADAKLYIGDYTARTTPVADTSTATATADTFEVMPGARTYIVTAPGMAQKKVTFSANANQVRDFPVPLTANLASTAAGATITGEGTQVPQAFDGLESTAALTIDGATDSQKRFTVALAGGRQVIRAVQVSAMSQPGLSIGRFQTLRQFRILTCDARGSVTCDSDDDFTAVYTSPADAFPGAAPRPGSPDLTMRSFTIPQTAATHVQVDLLANQCLGNPAFHGDMDNDPGSNSDCVTGYSGAKRTAVSEVQVMKR